MTDIETLYFSSAVSRFSILIVFLAILFSQAKSAYLYHWFVALLASCIGSGVSIFFSDKPVLPLGVAVFVYAFFFVSLVASWSGIRIFYNRKVKSSTFMFLVLFPCFIYCLGVFLNFPSRITLPFIYFMAAFVTCMVMYEIYNTPDRKIVSQYVVLLAFSLYFLALIVPGLLILTKVIPAEQNSSATAALLFDQCASVLVYFGYIAMAGEKANIAIQKLAETDPLTGLINRRGAQKLLENLYSKFLKGEEFCILICDIDFFKRINDSFGHPAGDAVIRGIAEIMILNLRKYDKAVRWGGEEFLIILPDTTILEAQIIADRLRISIENSHFLHCGNDINVTLSLGVSTVQSLDSSFENTITRADSGLYHSKKNGRNKVTCQL